MATTPNELSGLFKQVYGDDIQSLIPEAAKVVKMIPFVEREKETGDYYHQPVVLTLEHGITYAGATDGAFALNAAIAMNTKDAQIRGSQMLLRSSLSYDAASKSSGGNKKAFKKATELLVENMMESMMKRLEIAVFYGGSGIGMADTSANASGTSTVLQLSTASWATGIWAGMEGAKISLYKTSDGSLLNSNATLVVTVVDVVNRKVTVTGNSTDISAIDTWLGSGDADIYFYGAKGKEMTGLNTIITNTGTLFNIDAGAYQLWRGNTYSAGSAQATMGKILNGVGQAVQKGLDEKVSCFLNPNTWANIASDLAALRKYDGSYDKKKGVNGFEAITFYSQNGEIELVSHNVIKEGEAFVFPTKRVKRIGSQDVSFKTPGREDEIFLHLADNAGFELRLFTDQAVFVETPARCVKITNITNSN